MSERFKMVCTSCGGEDVTHDACARWCTEKQEWLLSATYDNADCDDCGGQTKIEQVDIDLLAKVEKHGYRLMPSRAFKKLQDPLVQKLLERAQDQNLNLRTWVLYDPNDNEQGWMLWGWVPDLLLQETFEKING